MPDPQRPARPDAASPPPGRWPGDLLSGLFCLVIVLFAASGAINDLARWLVELSTPDFADLSRRDQRLVLRDHPLSGGWRWVQQTLILPTGMQIGLPILLGFAICALQDTRILRGRALASLSLAVFGLWIAKTSGADAGILPSVSPLDYLAFPMSVALTLYLTQRQFGWIIVGFCLFWVGYYFVRGAIPEWAGIFHGADATAAQNLRLMLLSFWAQTGGMFGQPVQVVVGNILIFIVFGAIMTQSGAGTLLIRLAQRATGGMVGGPAQGAIVGSALFGTMSGAAVSNVVSTGTMTIPVIRRAGFSPAFAGGVEAAASSGGQILPPVMGVVAFFVAGQLGLEYRVVAVAAIVPAFMFYLSLMIAVRIEARRLGVGSMPLSERPPLTRTECLQSLVFVVPLGALSVFLFSQPSALKAGFFGVLTAFGCALVLFPGFRTRRAVWGACVRAGRLAAPIVVIVAAVGLIVGLVQISGFSTRLSALVVAMSDGPLLLTLVTLGLGAVVLGMGLPPGATYFILVVALATAFEAIELPPLTLHMFVVMFAMMSAVTPPVALAAFAAAPIAGAVPMATGIAAARIGAMGFLIPFVFAYHPEILFKAQSLLTVMGTEVPQSGATINPELLTWSDLTWILILYTLASVLIASALAGYGSAPIKRLGRMLRLTTGLLVLFPQPIVWIPSACVGLALLLYGSRARRTIATDTPRPPEGAGRCDAR